MSLLLATGLIAGLAQAAGLPDFRPIVERNTPAVVKILTEYAPGGGPRGESPHGDEIPEYLRRFFEFRGAPPEGMQRQRQSMGSGFILSEDGYVVTNNHVVAGADAIVVRLTDRREYEAVVIGLDERSDLALLKIEADDLPTLTLAAAGELEVGEWVLAIGSPFGLDYSVTAGIVSAKGRSLPTERNDNYVPFIQTDVAINPGNSGGPLFNLDGEVVGVNSQIYTRTGGSIGLSFAIPVSVVNNVVEQLKDKGRVTRGWLGVTIQNVDKNLAKSFGLDRPRGALISQLQSGGPADEGGLRNGDVIVRFDGEEIRTSDELPHVVGLIKPGTRVEVDIIRDRKRKTIKLAVGGLDADEVPSLAGTGPVENAGGRIGLVVTEVDEQLQSRWGITGGVAVSRVINGGAAARAGIRNGDVITLIGATPISSVATFDRVVSELDSGESVPVRLIRRGAPLFIGLKVD
jgi:serine protease Do